MTAATFTDTANEAAGRPDFAAQTDKPLDPTILNEFPQVREKAVVDAVNGIDVLDDHLGYRDRSQNCIVSRIWASLTGEAARRQQAIDRTAQGMLTGMTEWLHALQAAHARSDIAMKAVIDRLKETRQGVMRLQDRHNALASEVEEISVRLDAHISSTEDSLASLEEALREERLARRAWNDIEIMRSRWDSGSLDHLPLPTKVLQATDELYWGEFGACLRMEPSDDERQRLLTHARQTIWTLVRQEITPEQKNPLYHVENWLASLRGIAPERREILRYLLDEQVAPETRPVGVGFASALRDEATVLPLRLPRAMSADRLTEACVAELSTRNQRAA